MSDTKMIFTEDNLWIRKDGDLYTIGISEAGSEDAGNIVFVELPEVGTEVKAGDSIGCTESVKTVSPIIAPLSGTVVSVNPVVIEEPQTINESPYEDGWMFRISPSLPVTFGKIVKRGG